MIGASNGAKESTRPGSCPAACKVMSVEAETAPAPPAHCPGK